MSNRSEDVQLLVDMAYTFANEERYLLQPSKTVALNVRHSKRAKSTSVSELFFTMGNSRLNNVQSSLHLGIKRTSTVQETAEVNVENNSTKARRALYSLLGEGLHGNNGLDHETSINL